MKPEIKKVLKLYVKKTLRWMWGYANSPTKKSITSTDLYVTVAVLCGLYIFKDSIPEAYYLAFYNAMVAGYLAARMFMKKNRGRFMSGLFTSEFYAVGWAQYLNWEALEAGGDPRVVWGVIVGMAILYVVTRGVTKSIGVKTQVIT